MQNKIFRFNRLRILLIILVLFPAARVVFATDWPGIYGAHMDAVSTETRVVDRIPSSGLPVRWKSTLGIGLSGISAVNGKVYTLGMTSGAKVGANIYASGVPYIDKSCPCIEITLYCLDALNGKEIWHYIYNVPTRFMVMDWREKKPRPVWEDFIGPKSVPTVDENRVYIYDHTGVLTCLDAEIGKPIWVAAVREQFDALPPRYGYAASPAVADNLVIVPVFSQTVGMAAFNKLTGQLAWTGGEVLTNNNDRLRWDGYSTPRVVRDAAGKSQLVYYSGGGVEALDGPTGKTLWKYPIPHTSREVVMNPIVEGNYVFVSSHYAYKGFLLKIENNKPRLVMENKTMISHFTSFVSLDGSIYGTNGYDTTGDFRCIDMLTGKLRWSTIFKTAHQNEQGQVIIADKKLIILTSDGELKLAEATPKEFKSLGSFPILNPVSRSWCPMAFSNGLLFCKDTLGDICCVDMRKTGGDKVASAAAGKNLYRRDITIAERTKAGIKGSQSKKFQMLFGREKFFAGWIVAALWLGANLGYWRLRLLARKKTEGSFLRIVALIAGLPLTLLTRVLIKERSE